MQTGARIERLERMRAERSGVRYVISACPVDDNGLPIGDPEYREMSEDEWAARYVTPN